MASVSWTATSSGTWNNAANWSAAPQQGDDVTINTPGSSLTVTYTTGSLALDSLTTGGGDTFDMTGGTLSTADGFNLGGALAMSAGTLRLAASTGPNALSNSLNMTGGSLIFVGGVTANGGALNQSAGTITIDHGALVDQDSGALAGTLAGPGTFELAAGVGITTIFQSGFVLATGSVDIASGTIFLQESLKYANKFSLAGTLDLNGNAGTLTGYAALDGDINGGSLTVSGGGHLNGMILDNGAVLTVQNSINQSNSITLGGPTGTGTLDVTAKGTLRVTGNDFINQGTGAGYLVNNGLIDKTAGNSQSGTMVIFDTVTNAASGAIDAAVGTIDFRGSNGGQQSSIMGTLEGAGTVAFDGGSYLLSNVDLVSQRLLFAQSTNVTLATGETYGGNWQQTGGLLLLENNLTLTGTSDFAGGELKGTATVTDSGGLLTLGSNNLTMDLEGNLNFAFNGAIDQVGAINLGELSDSDDQATLGKGDTWSLEGASSISGAYGTITISSGATFARLDGAQNAVVASTVINNGSLVVDTGTLSLTGQGSLAGTVSGGAVLDISGQFSLASGVSLSVGELILDTPSQPNDIQASLGGNLSYAHDFAIEGGTLALNGHTLTLGGISTFGTGAIQGSGVVVDNGAATILNVALTQGGQLVFNGATEQTGNVTLTGGSTAPILSIGAGGVYTMDNATNIGGPGNSIVGTLTVAGGLVAAGPGTSIIAASVVNTGTISISHGQMAFLGPLSGAGAIAISAGGILDLDSSNATAAGIGFGTGGGLLYLYNPSDYDGTIGGFAAGDAVELNGFAFSNDGTATTFSVKGDTVTISEAQGGPSTTLTFSSAQSASQLMLGVGSHSGLALIHI